MSFELTSPAFQNGQPIPSKYTCEGENLSHALAWTNPPANTQSFVLINDDPDDDGPDPWVHWLAYNIPGQSRGLPENVPVIENLSDGTLQGLNSFKKMGYGGRVPADRVASLHLHTLCAGHYASALAPEATRWKSTQIDFLDERPHSQPRPVW